MTSCRRITSTVALCLAVGMPTSAQETAFEPCREVACILALEWTPPPLDRRYGNPAEFEDRLLGHLRGAGYAFVRGEASDRGALTFELRPRMVKAMCDRMAGTETAMNCQAIGEVRIAVHNVGPASNMRLSLVIRGQCGASEMMDVARMSEYVAAMIGHEFLAREKGSGPSSRC